MEEELDDDDDDDEFEDDVAGKAGRHDNSVFIASLTIKYNVVTKHAIDHLIPRGFGS